MSFIVIIIALLLERFAPFFNRLKHYQWVGAYLAMITKRLGGGSSLRVIAVVLPLIIATWLIHVILSGMMYGLLAWLFDLAVVLYCLGDSQLKQHVGHYLNLLGEDKKEATAFFTKHFSGEEPESPTFKSMLTLVLGESHRRVFALIFWYLILGVVGAALYRIVSLLVSFEMAAGEKECKAPCFLSLLDWIPERLTAFCFCLVGHFTVVFPAWCKHASSGLKRSYDVMSHCAFVALGWEDKADDLASREQLEPSFGLVDRSLVVWLVVVALLFLF
jgi:AmpE protein